MTSLYADLSDEEKVTTAVDFLVRELPIPQSLAAVMEPSLVAQLNKAQEAACLS